MVDAITVHPHDEVHVFTDRTSISSDFDHDILAKNAERPRNNQKRSEQVPCRTSREESARVFDALEHFDPCCRSCDTAHLPVDDFASVQRTHRSSDGNHFFILRKERTRPHETVVFKQRIGVHNTKEGIRRDVDTAIDRIVFTAVFFVHQDQIRIQKRQVHRPYRSVKHIQFDRFVDFHQFERADQPLKGCIRRAVVNDDDFILGIMQCKLRTDTAYDRSFFVVRGNDHGYRPVKRGRQGLV